MKSIILILVSLLFIQLNCQEKKEVLTNNNKANKMNTTPIYGIDFDIATPFEILINDFSLINYNDNDAMSGFYPINELLMSNKDQEIKVRLHSKTNKEYIAEDFAKYFNLKIVITNNTNFEKFQDLQIIKIPDTIKKMPYIEYKYFLNFNLPYRIKGWSNSCDLTKENEKYLLQEVQTFYQKIYQIVNDGDDKGFFKIISKRTQELMTAYYNSEILEKEQNELKERVHNARGKMNPIDFNKYNLKISGNGRLVTLEDENGDSPLYYITEDHDDYFGIILHRPYPNAPLEVIR